MTDILVLILFVLSGAASGWLGVDLLPVDKRAIASFIECLALEAAAPALFAPIEMFETLVILIFLYSYWLKIVKKAALALFACATIDIED